VSKKGVLNIGIVCGEHSGDRLGAGLIEELKKHYDVNLCGVGGPKLEKLGLKSSFHYSEINIMGLLDPLLSIFKLTRLRKNLINLFIKNNINLFIGIDSPDFNMGIHKALKKKCLNKNIQVVSHSVWGWRQGKVKSIMPYGAFIGISSNTDGLLHVSEISWERVENVEDVLKEGQEIEVKLIDIDERSGKLKLSRKVLLPKPEKKK